MATASKPKRQKKKKAAANLPPTAASRKSNPVNIEYEAKAKSMIKHAMSERGADWEALMDNLHALGVEISAKGLENKISRGGFSAGFMLQCMEALEMNVPILKR